MKRNRIVIDFGTALAPGGMSELDNRSRVSAFSPRQDNAPSPGVSPRGRRARFKTLINSSMKRTN